MIVSIKVSVNGNYKIPVTVQYGQNEPITEVITGRGHDGPYVKNIPYYHRDGDIVTVTVGLEENDDN